MEGDDAEILKLNLNVRPVFLLVEWARKQLLVTYQIHCDAAEADLKLKPI